MKTALIVSAAFSLSLATAYVVAQTAVQPPAMPPTTPPTSTGNAPPPYPPPPLHKDPTRNSTGTAGTTAAGTNGSMTGATGTTPTQQAMTMPITPFQMLDTNKAGLLTMDQARNDPWLSKNFTQCDANHNEEVTLNEYTNCTQKGAH